MRRGAKIGTEVIRLLIEVVKLAKAIIDLI